MVEKNKKREPRLQDGSKEAETDFEEEKRIAAETKTKIGEETIDAAQMAAFLSCYSRNRVHFSKDKVIDRIGDICKMSKGLIDREQFRLTPGNKKSKYIFKPEVQGILLMLLDTSYFDERKNDRLLSTRENLYRELVVNAKCYLNEMDRKVITTSPQFMNAECESILSEKISFKMQTLIRTIMHSEENVRLKLLMDTYDMLVDTYEKTSRMATHALATKWVYAHKFDDDKNGELYKGLMSADNLICFIIAVLAFRVNYSGVNTLPNGEELTYQNLYASVVKEDSYVLSDVNVKVYKEELAKKINLNEKRNQIYTKVQQVLDDADPEEKSVLNDLQFVLKCHEFWDGLSEDEAKASKKFYEQSMQQDMFDILNKVLNGPYDSPTLQELRRLGELRDLGKKKS